MERVKKIIGIMDPNGFSFRVSIERLIAFLRPEIEYEGKIQQVVSERISTKPYDVLTATCPYSAIVNRGAHWNPHHNSFFMTIAHKIYILNDMVSFKSIDKNASYAHMSRLGIHIPPTVALPQQDYRDLVEDPKAVPELIFSEHELFDLKEIGERIGYPAYMKPQSGGGWMGVVRINNSKELIDAYKKSGSKPMNLQKEIEYKEFVRTLGIGPQMIPMHYNPKATFSHERYLRNDSKAIEHNFLSTEEADEITKITKVINSFFGWDHNSCETLIAHDGTIYAIDYANAYPDSNLVSLHYYFPGIVKAMTRWLIFCAVTEKKKNFNFAANWHRYFAAKEKADKENLSYDQLLDMLADIADDYFETEKFEAFCREKLPDFDEKALEFFSHPMFDEILEKEVNYYFKVKREIPDKIDHYKGIHRFWIHCERNRLNSIANTTSCHESFKETSGTYKQE